MYTILDRKYGFDDFNDLFLAGGTRAAGRALWRGGDVTLIDGLLVNGTARSIGWIAAALRVIQSGYLYHYAFSMIIGLLLLLSWFVYG
jgi:NADH-quinone oxidoreductase subunit L